MENITMPRGDLRNVHFTVHDAKDSEGENKIIMIG